MASFLKSVLVYKRHNYVLCLGNFLFYVEKEKLILYSGKVFFFTPNITFQIMYFNLK